MPRKNLIIAIVLLCAAVLRFWGLDYNSLWTDELDSWRLISQPTLSAVINAVKLDAHPPIYFALLHYVITYLGDSEWMLRLPSVIAGIAAVYAIYLLGKQLYTSREGLISAAIMAVSWAPIYYSQEARSYSLLLFVSIILFYYWLRLMRSFQANETVSLGTIFGFVIASTSMCYLHYFGLQLVVLQLLGFAALFAFRPRILAKIGVVYGLIFLAYLPWLPTMLAQMNALTDVWIPNTTFLQSLEIFITFSYHVDWWMFAVFVVPAYAYAAIDGARSTKRDGQLRSLRALVFSSGGLLFLWATLPFLAAFIQSIVLRPVLVDRYMIILLPAVYLLLARGIAAMTIPVARVWTGLLCLALLVSLVFDDHYYSQPNKDQYREAAAHLVQLQETYNGFPIVAYTWREVHFDYYLERFGSKEKVGLLAGNIDDVGKLQNFLRKRNADGFWYLVGQRTPEQPFMALLDSNYTLVSEVELNAASARLYLLQE